MVSKLRIICKQTVGMASTDTQIDSVKIGRYLLVGHANLSVEIRRATGRFVVIQNLVHFDFFELLLDVHLGEARKLLYGIKPIIHLSRARTQRRVDRQQLSIDLPMKSQGTGAFPDNP